MEKQPVPFLPPSVSFHGEVTSEAALWASEQRFQAVFEQAAVGMAVVGLDGHWLKVNRKLADIVGYTAEELLGHSFADITHPDDLADDLDNVQRLLAGDIAFYTMEKRYIHKAGQTVWINLTVSLAHGRDGGPDHFISVIEDIDARKAAERDAALNAARLGDLAKVVERVAAARDLETLMGVIRPSIRQLTGADGATLVLREDGHCHYVDEDAIGPLWKGQRFPLETCISGWAMLNDAAAVIEDIFADPRIPHAAYRPTFVKSLSMVPVGHNPPTAAIGCYWARHHHASAEELALQQALADAMSVGLANIQLYHHLDKARRTAEAAAATTRVQAVALAENERLMRLFVEHAPAALAMFDRAMRYLAVSNRWVDDYGLAGISLLGNSHYQIFPEISETWRDIHRRALAGEVIQAEEDRFERADGSVQWLRWEVRPWYGPDDAIGGIAIFSEDISSIKNAQEEILRLNADLERKVADRTAELTAANAELEAFAYAVSHDLRGPLRALSGFSQALQEDFGDQLTGEASVYLNQIDIASRNMGKLIDGILVLSRVTRGELLRESIDLSAMATHLLTKLAGENPDRCVDWQVAPGLTVVGDPRLVETALANLLGNAWKYTSRTAQPRIRVEAGSTGGLTGICVVDNGAGFDDAYGARLFKPFQRLHRQDEFPGIGIGLATVQRIVHRHGGEIRAEGRPGNGATFCFTLSGDMPKESP
ncbi:MAG: PAS domain S-box protein [Magnetospirillum gryphiswaldense]|nr:PAS domain S-box protein [Magnetospirillum gryphiswaldense]